jgi:[lysine-biosynthesis-protein LysW]--L-2-aminoadipate ligase
MVQRTELRQGEGGEILLASPGHTAASPDRRGKIVRMIGRDCYLVRWPDGRETVVPVTAGTLLAPPAMGRVCVIGSPANLTTNALVESWRGRGIDAVLMPAGEAERTLRPGDVVLGRLDILPTLDGVEPGLLVLLWLERRGVRVLNPAGSLLTVHDKLRTARRLEEAGVPHPPTTSVRADDAPSGIELPVVLKPRFGSWGRDVLRCRDEVELEDALRSVRHRSWFRRHGAVLQTLLPSQGYDLRLVVANGEVVGGGERVAAPGEWRTNVSLGGRLRPIAGVLPAARALARAAAAAVGADLVGVDLMPLKDGGYVVLELNGAVDFDERYSIGGREPYAETARALGLERAQRAEPLGAWVSNGAVRLRS